MTGGVLLLRMGMVSCQAVGQTHQQQSVLQFYMGCGLPAQTSEHVDDCICQSLCACT